jgi:hypothetical protein
MPFLSMSPLLALIAGITSHKSQARFGVSFLCLPIHGDKTEGDPKPLLPFKVIEEGPAAVAFYRQSVIDTVFDSCKNTAQKLYPSAIVACGTAVFGNNDGQSSFVVYLPDDVFQRLGIELVIAQS